MPTSWHDTHPLTTPNAALAIQICLVWLLLLSLRQPFALCNIISQLRLLRMVPIGCWQQVSRGTPRVVPRVAPGCRSQAKESKPKTPKQQSESKHPKSKTLGKYPMQQNPKQNYQTKDAKAKLPNERSQTKDPIRKVPNQRFQSQNMETKDPEPKTPN